MIQVRANTEAAKAKLLKIEKALPALVEFVADKTAAQALAILVEATPKKWFGSVRAGWEIEKTGEGKRRVFNDRPTAKNGVAIIKFLEYGTANGGTGYIYPKTQFKERTSVRYVIRGGSIHTVTRRIRYKARLYMPLTRRAVAGWNDSLVYGVDYITPLRVRGIKPRRIVAGNLERIRQLQMANMKAAIKRVLNG